MNLDSIVFSDTLEILSPYDEIIFYPILEAVTIKVIIWLKKSEK